MIFKELDRYFKDKINFQPCFFTTKVYGGGQVTYPMQRGRNQSADLPVMIATLETQGDNIVVPVVTEDGLPLGEGYLQQDGWGGLRVLRRAIDIAGQTWPDKQATEDTTVFEVSQTLM